MSSVLSSGSSSTGAGSSTVSSDLTSRLRTFSFSEKTTVIIDLGVLVTKVGFAGEAKPRSVVPTKVVSQIGGLDNSKNIFEIDKEAELRFALIDFVNHLFIKHLLLTPKDKTVIISEPLFLPLRFRKMLLNVLFCDIQVASVFVAPGSLFALFGLGWRAGLVVDVDYAETSVLPVFENIPIIKAVESASIGFTDILENVREKLVAMEPPWPKQELEDKAVIEDIITSSAFFVDRYDRVVARRSGQTVTPVAGDATYPSSFAGKYPPLNIPGTIREAAGEPLFDEEADSSLTWLVLSALEKCPIDIRKTLSERIVLVGRCATFPGFGHRLCAELEAATSRASLGGRKLSSGVCSLKSFRVAQPPIATENVTWFGAAVFGHLEVASQRAITRDKYFTELKLIGSTEFNCSKVLTADWLTTPSLIPYPGGEGINTSTDATSTTC